MGVLTGLSAAALIKLLRLVERLTFGVHGDHVLTLLAAAEHAPGWRRIAALLGAAVIVIVGLRVLGRRSTGGTEVTEAIWLRSGRLDLPASVARAVLSIVTIGMGVSLGREAAPQLVGAATASRLSEWGELPTWQRRLVVASGAGAGFAAVYNVPLGGALLALEVMLGTLALPFVVPALLTSVTATAVAWIFLGNRPIYHIPTYVLHDSQLLYAVLMGPIIGIVAVGWTRLISAANAARPQRAGRYLAPIGAFGLLGLLSLQYPQLLGNGRAIVQLTLVGQLSLGLMAVLLVLKPLVTAACLGAGAPGGLFTPTLRGRRAARRRRRLAVVTRLAGRAGRQLCADRRRGVPRGGDAGAPVGDRADAGVDQALRRADGADAGGGDRGDDPGSPAGGGVDLLREAGASRAPRRAAGRQCGGGRRTARAR